jgi:hypothetical protein
MFPTVIMFRLMMTFSFDFISLNKSKSNSLISPITREKETKLINSIMKCFVLTLLVVQTSNYGQFNVLA